jgi:ferredoxin-NADP reductase
MAQPRSAEVVFARLLGASAPAGETLGFAGGQYVIVDTGLESATGRKVKRAYSVVSSDAEQGRFQLAVYRLESGPGSGFMSEVPAGTRVAFSGSWGKWHAPLPDEAPAVVVATDTGITAALGLLRGRAMASRLPRAELIWCRESEAYFLPVDTVRQWLPAELGAFHAVIVPPAGDAGRGAAVRAMVDAALGRRGEGATVFLAGDGAAILPLRDSLLARGLPEEQVRTECFFNGPKKSA